MSLVICFLKGRKDLGKKGPAAFVSPPVMVMVAKRYWRSLLRESRWLRQLLVSSNPRRVLRCKKRAVGSFKPVAKWWSSFKPKTFANHLHSLFWSFFFQLSFLLFWSREISKFESQHLIKLLSESLFVNFCEAVGWLTSDYMMEWQCGTNLLLGSFTTTSLMSWPWIDFLQIKSFYVPILTGNKQHARLCFSKKSNKRTYNIFPNTNKHRKNFPGNFFQENKRTIQNFNLNTEVVWFNFSIIACKKPKSSSQLFQKSEQTSWAHSILLNIHLQH